jgi:hypothetical protein
LDGESASICRGLSKTTNIASWWHRVPWLIGRLKIGLKSAFVALCMAPGV